MADSRNDPDRLQELGLNPDMKDPFANGVARRRVLQASGAGATAALAGCLGSDDAEGAPTVYVFNTGDRTVSIIDAEADELVETAFIGATASFPANQYGTGAESDYDVLWLNVDSGVLGIDQSSLEEVAEIETGFGSNYPNLTPDGEHLIIASGGTLGMDPNPDNPENHYYYRVDANPDSDTFGEITAEIERGYEGPCDMTIGPDGEYAFAVDVANETISVLQVDPFETAAQVDVGQSVVEDGNVLPFMCTATFDGEYLLIENGEGELGSDGERVGSESIWDISDPLDPSEVAKVGPEDGLPAPPITSEVDPAGETGYLFIPGASGVGVLDIANQEYTDTIDVGGATIAGAWGPNREKLYAPVQSENEVAVIDHADQEVTATIEVGPAPVGAASGMTQANVDGGEAMRAQLASLGVGWGDLYKTYCYPDCYCGSVL